MVSPGFQVVRGSDGTVQIETPGFDFTGSLQPLPTEFASVVSLLRDRCAARRGASASFVVTRAPAGPEPGLLPVEAAEAPAVSSADSEVTLFAGAGGPWQARCGG